MTDLLLFGIVSLPWSPLASLPPEVDVPLPLLFGAIPVVSDEPFELAELAAGRGVPRLPGLLWANASGPDTRKTTDVVTAASFMVGLPSANLTEANGNDAAPFQLPTYPNCRSSFRFAISAKRRGTLASSPNLPCGAEG